MARMWGSEVCCRSFTTTKPRCVDSYLGVLQAQALRHGAATDRHQHAVEGKGLFPVGIFYLDFDLFAGVFEAQHLGPQVDLGKQFFESLVQRLDQIAIRARKQTVQQFDHGNLAPKLGVDGPHLQADVSATDHQQRLGDVFQLECTGRIHHAR